MSFALPVPGNPGGINISFPNGLRPSTPRPPGKVPGLPGSSLQWLTPAAACALLGTHCANPFSDKKPWEGQPGTERALYRARCDFKGERTRVSTGQLIQTTESHTVLTVLGPVKDLTTITQPFASYPEAVFFKVVGTASNGGETVSTSLLLITSVDADRLWKITEVTFSLERVDQEDDPPLAPSLVTPDGLAIPITASSGASTASPSPIAVGEPVTIFIPEAPIIDPFPDTKPTTKPDFPPSPGPFPIPPPIDPISPPSNPPPPTEVGPPVTIFPPNGSPTTQPDPPVTTPPPPPPPLIQTFQPSPGLGTTTKPGVKGGVRNAPPQTIQDLTPSPTLAPPIPGIASSPQPPQLPAPLPIPAPFPIEQEQDQSENAPVVEPTLDPIITGDDPIVGENIPTTEPESFPDSDIDSSLPEPSPESEETSVEDAPVIVPELPAPFVPPFDPFPNRPPTPIEPTSPNTSPQPEGSPTGGTVIEIEPFPDKENFIDPLPEREKPEKPEPEPEKETETEPNQEPSPETQPATVPSPAPAPFPNPAPVPTPTTTPTTTPSTVPAPLPGVIPGPTITPNSPPTTTPTPSTVPSPIPSPNSPGVTPTKTPVKNPVPSPTPAFEAPLLPPNPVTTRNPSTGTGTSTGGHTCDPCITSVRTNVQRNGDKLSGINTALQGLDLALLQEINEKLGPKVDGGLSGWLKRFSNALRFDRALQVFNTMLLLHNAAQVSRSLLDSLSFFVDSGLQVIGLKDEDDNPLDITGLVGNFVSTQIKNIVGEDIYNGVSETWKKTSAIYTAAMNIYQLMLSSMAGIAEGLEIVGQYTGRIGNALKKGGVVLEGAYGWMNEFVTVKTGRFGSIQKVINEVQSVEEVVSNLTEVTEQIKETQENVEEIREQFQVVRANTTQAEQVKTKNENEGKGRSFSPPISTSDLVNPSE